jgi:anaerobic selenocysteine-containing dehydrogenase
MSTTRSEPPSVRGQLPGGDGTSEVRTFCRICEPSCGLVATVELGRVTALRADQDHPVTKGFACHKGLAGVDINHDPDRLDHPQLRAVDGTWSTVGWDDAITHTARRLQAITAEHGPNAISAYIGNPTAFNALASLHMPWGRPGDRLWADIYYQRELQWSRVMAPCRVVEGAFWDPPRRRATPAADF